MTQHEINLAENHLRNKKYLKNLRNFVADHFRFVRLDPEDQALILKQIQHMADLNDVYEARMRRLNIPV